MRIRYYSYQTEKAYLHWINYFIRFNGYKRPKTWEILKLNDS
ncbi:phage integrase N-terminal SAM-like domain-containing protein [Catenovulum sp. 2E275]|nr:phage integrase N-terminal SAM-like domain-containing protein [Catenovulum sp. 2E275]MCU4675726.1 phage integrase N-terminal SAM-like domain-containing protein [Catenovulum sp. 2E275]